jgi:hypothetical protein
MTHIAGMGTAEPVIVPERNSRGYQQAARQKEAGQSKFPVAGATEKHYQLTEV